MNFPLERHALAFRDPAAHFLTQAFDGGAAALARVYQQVAVLFGDLPAALITANRDPAAVAIARGQRVDVLLKPVKPAQLRALIAQRAASAE